MKKITLLLLLTSFFGFSQNADIDSLTHLLKTTKNKHDIALLKLQLAKLNERVDIKKGKALALEAYRYKADDSLLAESTNQLGRLYFFTAQLDSATYYFEETKKIASVMKDAKRVAAINISLGAIQLRQGDYNKTIKTLTESAAFFENEQDSLNAAKCYSNIATAFAELELFPKAIEYSEKALFIFRQKSQTNFEMITLPNLATQYYKNGDTLSAIDYNDQAEALATKLNDKRSLSLIYNNLGDLYLTKDPEKAKAYLEKTLQLKNELNLKTGIEITQSNLGYIHLQNKEYQTAIDYFNEASKNVKGKQLVTVYNNLKDSYKGLGQIDKALEYSEKSEFLNDSILNKENQENFIEVQTKYEIEKKENEILELKTDNLEANLKRKQNRNLLITALSLLLITLLLAYFYFNSLKKKRVITQQKLTIKNQEFDQLLKTQELAGIDAIMDAQEKERTKMAADLHDNLGSKVATLKLYAENFEEEEGAIDKLKNLIGDTYSEIRKMSQNKNFGAYINKGLIPSTEVIAKQISDSNKLDIKVINVDVNHRIENTIEIQIFRIIQELLTNVMKHSEASEVIIQFSEHETVLNIVVEDNGRGFDLHQNSNGLGLINIEKRVEKINGEVVIDSSIGNGTTVILNIPI